MDWGKKSYHFKTKNKYLQIPSPEGSSGEGREAESDDCADVPLERRVEDALLQAEHGLVHEAQSQTQLNVLVRGGDLGGGGGGGHRGGEGARNGAYPNLIPFIER